MLTKLQVEEVLDMLEGLYPTASTELVFSTPYELLVSTILSAQCTDARVNVVTKELFKKYNTPEQMITLTQEELEKLIHSCGFYHNKAKNIIACTKALVERFHGEVPRSLEELTSLAGVGRKTANVIRGNIAGRRQKNGQRGGQHSFWNRRDRGGYACFQGVQSNRHYQR